MSNDNDFSSLEQAYECKSTLERLLAEAMAELGSKDRRRQEMSNKAYAEWREGISRKISDVRIALVNVRDWIGKYKTRQREENRKQEEEKRQAALVRKAATNPEVLRVKRAHDHKKIGVTGSATERLFLNIRPIDVPDAVLKGARLLRARLFLMESTQLVKARQLIQALEDYLASIDWDVTDDNAVIDAYLPLLEAERASANNVNG